MRERWGAWGCLFSAIGLAGITGPAHGAGGGGPPPTVAVALTAPAIFLSPYCWRLDPTGAAICPAAGGYLKFRVRGTTFLGVRVNPSINRGLAARQMPTLKAVINQPRRDGPAQYIQFPPDPAADVELTVAQGLDPAVEYAVSLQVIGGDETQFSGWSGSIFQTQLNRLVVDAGATLAPALLRPHRALFLGASYEQAYFGKEDLTAPVYTYVDVSRSWPFFTAYALGCEYGQVGIGSQGWVRHGNGGYPPFPESWNHFDRDHPKTFGSDLDYVFVHLAENDAAQPEAQVRAAVQAWIPAARAAFGPRTKLFIILSLPQIKSEQIRAGVRAAADPLTYLLDPGEEFRHTVFAGGPTWAAPADGIHLDAVHQAIFTAFVTRQAQACLDAASPRP